MLHALNRIFSFSTVYTQHFHVPLAADLHYHSVVMQQAMRRLVEGELPSCALAVVVPSDSSPSAILFFSVHCENRTLAPGEGARSSRLLRSALTKSTALPTSRQSATCTSNESHVYRSHCLTTPSPLRPFPSTFSQFSCAFGLLSRTAFVIYCVSFFFCSINRVH